MRLLNKHFLIGLSVGVALTLATVDTAAIFAARRFWVAEKGSILKAKGLVSDNPDLWKAFPAPFFPKPWTRSLERWSVRPLGGPPVTLGELKGKVVFLNFWSTGCAPCVAEMPGIENLFASLKDEQVVFLIATAEDEQTVRHFLNKHPFRVPVYLYGEDLPTEFQLRGFPTTLILDRNGAMVFRHSGPANWDDENARKFIRSLEGSPAIHSPA